MEPVIPAPPVVAPRTPDFVPPPTVPSTSAAIVQPPFEFGPGAPALGLRYSLGVSEDFTDNFDQSEDNRRENFRTSVSPGAVLSINTPFTQGRIGLSLTGAHDTITDDTSIFGSLLGSVRWQATPLLTFTISDAFTRSDEPSQADRLSLRRDRSTFTSNTLFAGADYSLRTIGAGLYYRLATFSGDDDRDTEAHTIGTRLTANLYETNTVALGYEYLTSENSGVSVLATTPSGTVTTTGHRISGSFTRRLTSLTAAGVSGDYSFRDRSGAALISGEDFDIWTGSVFVNRSTPTLSLSVNAGYSQFVGTGTDGSFFTASSLAYRFARAVLSLGVDSGFAETFAEGQDFGVVQTRGVTGALSYPFTPFIGGTIASYYRHNDFTEGTGGTGRDVEDTWGASASASVQLRRWLTLLIEYTHTETTRTPEDFTENRGIISLGASF